MFWNVRKTLIILVLKLKRLSWVKICKQIKRAHAFPRVFCSTPEPAFETLPRCLWWNFLNEHNSLDCGYFLQSWSTLYILFYVYMYLFATLFIFLIFPTICSRTDFSYYFFGLFSMDVFGDILNSWMWFILDDAKLYRCGCQIKLLCRMRNG